MKYPIGLAFFFMFTLDVSAKSLGTIGQTFPVLEKSLLTLIYERLNTFQQSGALDELEKAWVKQVEQKSARPLPLHLTRINKTQIHYYKPVVMLPQDIKDAAGKIILNHGASVNALTQLPAYQPIWVFINYNDEAQRKYAAALLIQYPNAKWILTAGDLRDAEHQLNQPIYFDQEGRITQKLKIKHVPALVTRYKDSLKITEFSIGEDGHAF